MKENKHTELRELLGPEYSEAELEKIARDMPELRDSALKLNSNFQQARHSDLPRLSADFTARVMEKIEKPGQLESFWQRFFSLQNMAWASAASVVLVVGLWWGSRALQEAPVQNLAVRTEVVGESGASYRVKFSVKQGGVRSISLAGDFNYWTPVKLRPSAQDQETLTVEVSVPEGTHNYAFLVDGKNWLADANAEQGIDDGFGRKNSILNL